MDGFVRELCKSGFNTENCAKRLGVFPRLGVNYWREMRPNWRPDPGDPVDNLIALFIDNEELDVNLFVRQFSPDFVDAALEMQLAQRSGKSISSDICLFPCYGKYLATDQAARNHSINQVMWLWGESFILGGLVKRVPRRRAVDLGTGSGIHAILASDHCDRVVAVDVNPRALSFAKFNAALNGRHNLEFVLSDLLTLVGGTFDQLMANPPYAPDYASNAGDNFWSGGATGTELLRRVVQALPTTLESNGVAYIVALYPNPVGTTIKSNFDDWLGGGIAEWNVLDHTWPVPRYEDLFSERPYLGEKTAWRFGVVSLRRSPTGNGWWKEVAGKAIFFRNDGSCSVVSDPECFTPEG